MALTALALALALAATAAAATPPAAPPPLPSWALLVSGSADAADARHAAGAAALAGVLAARSPPRARTRTLLFLSSDLAATFSALLPTPPTPLPASLPVTMVGPDVTPAAIVAALSGKHADWEPDGWRLPGGQHPTSTGLVFLTGHGGPRFLRVGGASLTRAALARGMAAALARGAAGRLLLVADTCKAASLAPPPSLHAGITAIASAAGDEASHSSGWWAGGGAGGYVGARAERFTAALVVSLLLMEGSDGGSDGGRGEETLADLLARPTFAPAALLSTPVIMGDSAWRVADFFGS
jgi:hypothetical protein